MSRLWPDTHPDAERVLIAMMRETPTWRKLDMVGQMYETVRAFAMAGLRARHPNDTPEQLHRRLADLQLGPELAARVYGPLTEQDREGCSKSQSQ